MTFALGAASNAHLADVHPKLVAVVRRAITLTTQDFSVNGGVRDQATQDHYLARGVTQLKHSLHMIQPDGFGHAVDLVPFVSPPGALRWEWPLIYPIAAAMREAAIDLGVRVRWGGAWDTVLNNVTVLPTQRPADVLKALSDGYAARHPGPDFLDGPHYELAQ